MEKMAIDQLSEPQQKILSFINRYMEENDIPPTIREIQHGTNISSTSMVSYHLKALERAQLLNRRERRSRGLVMNEPHRVHPRDVIAIPMMGVITCGAEPMPTPDADALAESENMVHLARSMVGNMDGLYALEAKGDSMIDALINDGDIVIMRRETEVKNGDLAAVFLRNRNETTLKRVYKEGKRLKLKPENPTLKPFYVDAQQAQIQGRVVCVIRRA